MDIKPYVERFVHIFESHRNPADSVSMQKYMKNHFPFLGIRAPERKQLLKPLMKDIGFLENEQIRPFITELWELPEREYQYVAVEYLVKYKKKLIETDIDLLEYLIVNKSWWDTVDLIASHLVGSLLLKYPNFINERGDDWVNSDNMWLKRTMILFQLKYKNQTNETLLFSIIDQTAHINEFFIQKAIGWALREYSKTNPEAVVHFIESRELSNLSKREGLKWIARNE